MPAVITPYPTPTDRCLGFAWFKLVFGITYMAFGMFCLIIFFRSRDVFEIRAR